QAKFAFNKNERAGDYPCVVAEQKATQCGEYRRDVNEGRRARLRIAQRGILLSHNCRSYSGKLTCGIAKQLDSAGISVYGSRGSCENEGQSNEGFIPFRQKLAYSGSRRSQRHVASAVASSHAFRP